MDETTAVIVVIGGIVLLIVFAVVMRFFGLWIQCVTTRADISLLNLILMRLRKVNPTVIVRSKIMATQAQLSKVFSISRQQLEAHYLAGGNVPNVIRALVASNRARQLNHRRPREHNRPPDWAIHYRDRAGPA